MHAHPRWAVSLEGESFDLKDACYAFGGDTSIRVAEVEVPNRKITALTADELDGHDEAAVVNEAAERLVVLINGYLFSRDASRSPLRVGGIYSRDASGRWTPGAIFITAFVAVGRARARAYASVIHADGSTTSPDEQAPEIQWLSTYMDDTALDVLHMLRAEPDWFDLFMAFERMRDDLNRRLPNKAKPTVIGWPDTNHFAQSAQVYRHSRAKWPVGYNPTKAMSLSDARVLVAGLVKSWLKWCSAQENAERSRESRPEHNETV